MKILKKGKKIKKRLNYQEATIGCNVCPCCGNKNINKYGPFVEEIIHLFGPVEVTRVVRYDCNHCGAKWRSEYY